MKIKGIFRDLLLVGISALVAVFAVRFTEQKQISPVSGISSVSSELASVEGDGAAADLATSVEEQLLALKMEMYRADAALDEKISLLSQGPGKLDNVLFSDVSLVAGLSDQPTFEDLSATLSSNEENDYAASEEMYTRMETHLTELTLSNTRVNQVDCYSSKCTAELEHDSAIDRTLFVDHVLYNSKGLFTGRFSYAAGTREDGSLYTKLIFDR